MLSRPSMGIPFQNDRDVPRPQVLGYSKHLIRQWRKLQGFYFEPFSIWTPRLHGWRPWHRGWRLPRWVGGLRALQGSSLIQASPRCTATWLCAAASCHGPAPRYMRLQAHLVGAGVAPTTTATTAPTALKPQPTPTPAPTAPAPGQSSAYNAVEASASALLDVAERIGGEVNAFRGLPPLIGVFFRSGVCLLRSRKS